MAPFCLLVDSFPGLEVWFGSKACVGNSTPPTPSSRKHRLSRSELGSTTIKYVGYKEQLLAFLPKDEQKWRKTFMSFPGNLYSAWWDVPTTQNEERLGEFAQNPVLDLCLPGMGHRWSSGRGDILELGVCWLRSRRCRLIRGISDWDKFIIHKWETWVGGQSSKVVSP